MNRKEYDSMPKSILVDLDGTLAKSGGDHIPGRIGEPIPLMLDRVKSWLKQGKEVRIFTARVGNFKSPTDIDIEKQAIEKWLITHLGQSLPITCTKDIYVSEIWDDRAIQVIRNTGIRADGNTN